MGNVWVVLESMQCFDQNYSSTTWREVVGYHLWNLEDAASLPALFLWLCLATATWYDQNCHHPYSQKPIVPILNDHNTFIFLSPLHSLFMRMNREGAPKKMCVKVWWNTILLNNFLDPLIIIITFIIIMITIFAMIMINHSGHHLWLDNVLETSFPLASDRSTCWPIGWLQLSQRLNHHHNNVDEKNPHFSQLCWAKGPLGEQIFSVFLGLP